MYSGGTSDHRAAYQIARVTRAVIQLINAIPPTYHAMPEPIATTTILALQSLASNLVESVKDRRSAGEAKEILRLVGSLQSEFFALQQLILKLESENVRLQQGSALAQRKVTTPPATVLLDELAAKMMLLLANEEDGASMDTLLAHMDLSPAKGAYFFDQLVEHKFVVQTRFVPDDGAIWAATSGGRRYLVDCGLL